MDYDSPSVDDIDSTSVRTGYANTSKGVYFGILQFLTCDSDGRRLTYNHYCRSRLLGGVGGLCCDSSEAVVDAYEFTFG